jgi:hypothetical protein
VDAGGPGGDGGQDEVRCGEGDLLDVVLAQAEEVQAGVLREDPLRDETADVLRLAEQVTAVTGRQVPETVDADHDLTFRARVRHLHHLTYG